MGPSAQAGRELKSTGHVMRSVQVGGELKPTGHVMRSVQVGGELLSCIAEIGSQGLAAHVSLIALHKQSRSSFALPVHAPEG